VDGGFFAGPARLVPYPVEVTATFTKNQDGQVTALRWKQTGWPEVPFLNFSFSFHSYSLTPRRSELSERTKNVAMDEDENLASVRFLSQSEEDHKQCSKHSGSIVGQS
jgi:hypothetical protein